jgi:DNA-binding HxlR family transcriptional regulator
MSTQTRSYHQYCPVAHTLDIIGDRWALLIVRDLLVGPKRFVDLRTSLRGIVTNILTDRLRELEGAGVLQRRYLPPPAASTVYELTAEGRALEPILAAMAHWGGSSLGTPGEGQTVSSESVRWALGHIFHPLAGLPVQAVVVVTWDEPPFNGEYAVDCREQRVRVEPGSADAPDLRLQLDVATLFALSSGQRSIAAALAEGSLIIEGPEELVTRLRITDPL